MHPPLGKLERKNSTKIIAIEINEPRMVKLVSLVEEKFGPSFNVIIITVRNIKITKNSGRRRMISQIFFKNYFVKINTVEKYPLRIGNLVINWFKMDRLGLNQNISVKRKSLQWMLRNPMKIWGKIRYN
jgi:hypothetical protein